MRVKLFVGSNFFTLLDYLSDSFSKHTNFNVRCNLLEIRRQFRSIWQGQWQGNEFIPYLSEPVSCAHHDAGIMNLLLTLPLLWIGCTTSNNQLRNEISIVPQTSFPRWKEGCPWIRKSWSPGSLTTATK